MRTNALGVIVCLTAACGDASGAESESGELVACDETRMNGSVLETGARVAATAGEILTITYCYSYWYTNGVAETPPVGDPDGCFSVEIIPEEDEYFVQCGLKQQGRQCAESEWEPLIKHDVRQDGTIVSQYYELIDAGSDPTKVWVYAVGDNSSLNCGSDHDLVNCGASLDKNILTYHFQPTLYADGIAVVECGEQFRLPDDTVVDRRKFLSFEVEIKP